MVEGQPCVFTLSTAGMFAQVFVGSEHFARGLLAFELMLYITLKCNDKATPAFTETHTQTQAGLFD